MPTCEHHQQSLFDYVYDLLEPGELQEMREHLETCSACQAALAKVHTQQKLLQRAAHAITEVPLFTLPAGSVDCSPVHQEHADTVQHEPAASNPSPTPTTQAMQEATREKPAEPATSVQNAVTLAPATPRLRSQRSPKRPLWQRPWIAWTVAATLLLAISAAISMYRRTVHDLQGELTARRKENDKIAEQVPALPATYQDLRADAIRGARIKTKPYVNVVGPTQILPGAKGSLQVTTRGVEGELAASKIHVQLIDDTTKKVLQQTVADSPGEIRVEIDATRADPNSKLNVQVDAMAGLGDSVHETMQVLSPTYVTRID